MEIYNFLKLRIRICDIIIYWVLIKLRHNISWLLKKHQLSYPQKSYKFRGYYKYVFTMIKCISFYNDKIYNFACKMYASYISFRKNGNLCGHYINYRKKSVY